MLYNGSFTSSQWWPVSSGHPVCISKLYVNIIHNEESIFIKFEIIITHFEKLVTKSLDFDKSSSLSFSRAILLLVWRVTDVRVLIFYSITLATANLRHSRVSVSTRCPLQSRDRRRRLLLRPLACVRARVAHRRITNVSGARARSGRGQWQLPPPHVLPVLSCATTAASRIVRLSVCLSVCLCVCARVRATDCLTLIHLFHSSPSPSDTPFLPPHLDFTTTAPLLYSAICAFPLKGELPRRKLRFTLILSAYAVINTCQP